MSTSTTPAVGPDQPDPIRDIKAALEGREGWHDLSAKVQRKGDTLLIAGLCVTPPAEAQAQVRPEKPAECADGCPERQVCDHCQYPPGPDAEAQPVAWIAQCELDSLKDAARGVLKAYGVVWSAPTGQAGVALYDCSPSSAPVGVEGLAGRAAQLYEAATNAGATHEQALHEAIERALAQQPAAHPDDAAVDSFAAAMKQKLADARAKGRGGWDGDEPGIQQRLSDMLRAHVGKGDPRDVANFAMFLHQRGEAILPGRQPAALRIAEPVLNRATPGTREAEMAVLETDENGVPTIWCDPEIADLVRALNVRGVRTVASCSGHGERLGSIALADGRVLVICSSPDEAIAVIRSHEGQQPAAVDGADRRDATVVAGGQGWPQPGTREARG